MSGAGSTSSQLLFIKDWSSSRNSAILDPTEWEMAELYKFEMRHTSYLRNVIQVHLAYTVGTYFLPVEILAHATTVIPYMCLEGESCGHLNSLL